MLKGTLAASALVLSLSLAGPASAGERTASVVPPSPSDQTSFQQEVPTVESRPTAGGIIVRDAFGGAVLGAAVGGGVAAYRRYVSSDATWGNWQRDVLLGAGIGLAAGLVLGAVDAASNADRAPTGPIADERRSGFDAPIAAYGARF
ncbi:MAG TPA: hypothetical protein VE964_06665 [Myxococcales bacterium]|nr:hypothetical protein [Myxococcales bacterium]